MPSIVSNAPRDRAPAWAGWRVVDLAMMTGRALALCQRESPIVAVITGNPREDHHA